MDELKLRQLIKEEVFNVFYKTLQPLKNIENYLTLNLKIFLKQSLELRPYNEFTLYRDNQGNPKYYNNSYMFDKTIKQLELGNIKFKTTSGYKVTASPSGNNIRVIFNNV